MLTFLKINDFALIENAEVEFAPGFTAITGESGSGKSILMSSIELLTGGRVDRGGIRSGCKQYTVCGEFTIPETLKGEISAILEDAGIGFSPDEPLLRLRRVVGLNATRNFINDIRNGTDHAPIHLHEHQKTMMAQNAGYDSIYCGQPIKLEY